MADAITHLVVDCSVVVKWKILAEDHAAAAAALFGDWEHHVVDVLVPHHFSSEVVSAFLRVSRRGRLTTGEAREAIRALLALPFVLCDVTALADRAFTIAHQHQQRAYDCLYVALTERDGSSCGRVMSAYTMLCMPSTPWCGGLRTISSWFYFLSAYCRANSGQNPHTVPGGAA
jgi:predicted nucleic acid-binding protein